ncbi:MAG: peptidase [Planctomycetota bacterium]|nr:MAG: peptidase [Planctomycetota bacterium]
MVSSTIRLKCAASLALAAASVAAFPAIVHAQRVGLPDGRVLTGAVALTSGVADTPEKASNQAGEVVTKPILVVDDNLRRVYVPRHPQMQIVDQAPEAPVVIRPWQAPSQGAAKLVSVGPALTLTPFDEFGRRIYEMQLGDDRLSVVQGITELTPRYAKVSALQGPERSIAWEMSLATSSIPADTLAKILAKAIPQDDPQARLQAVRFYQQAERFAEARRELERIIEEFPEMKDLNSVVAQLRQSGARQLFDELELRRSAGQHKLVKALLDNFPTEEVAGETLVQVRQITSQYEAADARIKQIGKALQQTVNGIADADHRGLAAPIAEEVVRELSFNNVDRLASFAQLLDDQSLTAEEKTALALTGWLLGKDDAQQELPVAISLVKIRDAVQRYLREPLAKDRKPILDSVVSMEGASVDQLAKLIAHMKPAWHDSKQAATPGGYLQLAAPGETQDGDFVYHVQLPPEYDPYRRYPTLVALNGSYNTPENELDFWAGTPAAASGSDAPARRGQAMRHGYIVIAVQWQKPHQYEYEYSAREHIAVLTSLRDAVRRFSVDTDRVFLTGHDIGGEAAWDLGQAHPDLWAGVIPIIPRHEQQQKYINFYRDNAQYVPFYFVAGELDGRTIAENAPVWNKYLRINRYDVTLVEYQGRGHEPFHDEILHLLQWMGLKKRGGPPAEFACSTLRPWDNFFWWLECEEFPANFMVYPTDWGGRTTPGQVAGRVQPDNRLAAKTVAGRTTIWLNPDIVDFSKPLRITFNGKKLPTDAAAVHPDPAVLLEDVRTRGDRFRPFWAKVEVP